MAAADVGECFSFPCVGVCFNGGILGRVLLSRAGERKLRAAASCNCVCVVWGSDRRWREEGIEGVDDGSSGCCCRTLYFDDDDDDDGDDGVTTAPIFDGFGIETTDGTRPVFFLSPLVAAWLTDWIMLFLISSLAGTYRTKDKGGNLIARKIQRSFPPKLSLNCWRGWWLWLMWGIIIFAQCILLSAEK